MNLLADENIPGDLIKLLRDEGFDVDSVREKFTGYPDVELIKIAQNSDTILLTEDKDFGEWVFAYQVKNVSVIFLRYEKVDYPEIKKSLLSLLHSLVERGKIKRFITINKNKIRIRLL